MSTANQHPRTSVQRLRVAESAIATLGSQLPSPRTLRPGRPSGLNMPHPTRPGVQGGPRGLAAPAMGQRAAVKRWHTAQIAALLRWKCLSSRRKACFLHHVMPAQAGVPLASHVEGSGTPAFAGNDGVGENASSSLPSTSRASAHHHTTTFFRRPLRADVMAGAVPPFFSKRGSAMR